MILPKNNHGFSLIPIMVFLAIFSVIGFGVSNYLQNNSDIENDVLAAFAQSNTIKCIQSPSSAGCENLYKKPAVNKSFFQGSNDTKPPWWRPVRGGGGGSDQQGNDICDTQPGSQACADWQKFKAYCDDNAAKNPENTDPNCTNYLRSVGKFKRDQNQAFAEYCKTSQGRSDANCRTLICNTDPNDSICRASSQTPGTTATPSRTVTPVSTPIPNPSPQVVQVQKTFCAERPTPSICADNGLSQDELIFICKMFPNKYGCPSVNLPNPAPAPVNQSEFTTRGNCPTLYTNQEVNTSTGIKTCKLKAGFSYKRNSCGADKVIAYNTINGLFICQTVSSTTVTPPLTTTITPTASKNVCNKFIRGGLVIATLKNNCNDKNELPAETVISSTCKNLKLRTTRNACGLFDSRFPVVIQCVENDTGIGHQAPLKRCDFSREAYDSLPFER